MFKKVLFLFIFIFNISTSLVYLFNPRFHREDWRGLVSYLKRENKGKFPVLIIKEVEKPFLYYDLGKSNLFYFSQVGEEFKAYDTIWVVPYSEDIFDPLKTQRKLLKSLGFKNVLTRHFNGVTLEKFIKRKE